MSILIMENPFEKSPPPSDTGERRNLPHITGAVHSARFDLSRAANDELYDRRKNKNPKKTKVVEKKEESEKKIYSRYTKMALAPDGNLETAIALWKRDTIENLFTTADILRKSGDGTFVLGRKDLLVEKGWTSWNQGSHKKGLAPHWKFPKVIHEKYRPVEQSVVLQGRDFLPYLESTVAMDPDDPEKKALPLTALPPSLDDVRDGRHPPCHAKPWEIPTLANTNMLTPISLKDGTFTSLAEMKIIDRLRELEMKREADNKVYITSPETGKRVLLTVNTLRKFFPNIGNYYKDDSLQDRPGEFLQDNLPYIFKKGLLRPSDFKKTAQKFDTVLAPSDRRLAAKTPDLSLQTPGGKSIKYYIGREKIVGTDTPYDREHMVIRYLDNRTCGIVRIDKNFEEILYIFPLLSPEEIERRRAEKIEELRAKGIDITEQNISGRVYFAGPEMKNLIRPYRVSEFITKFAKESDQEYADRVAKLSDARLVSKEAREFFQQFGIGLHQLPWAEQLGASSILLDPRFTREEIGKFCKQYGREGLRTFISSTSGSNINRDILALGEKSPEVARATFQKYAEILAGTDGISETLQLFGKEELDPAARQKIIEDVKNNILQRAKSVLEKIASQVGSAKKITPKLSDHLFRELEQSRTDITLFVAAFKAVRQSGQEVSLDELKNLNWQSAIKAEAIAEEDREEMQKIYTDNYSSSQYSPEFRKILAQGLEERFNNPACRFYLLKHQNGDVIGFNAYEDTEKDRDGSPHVYFGAFNINKAYGSSKLGEALLDSTLESEGKDKVIDAHCDSRSLMSDKYLREGFVATEVLNMDGSPSFAISRDLLKNQGLVTKQTQETMTLPVLEKLAKQGSPRDYIKVRKLGIGEPVSKSLFEEGYVLTLYRFTPDGTRYCVFEKPQSKEVV